MNAQEFANGLSHPVVFFVSVGIPAGTEIALLTETELPFDLTDVDVDADGRWDGQGDLTDWNRNTVTKITVHDHKQIWTEQAEEAGVI